MCRDDELEWGVPIIFGCFLGFIFFGVLAILFPEDLDVYYKCTTLDNTEITAYECDKDSMSCETLEGKVIKVKDFYEIER